MAVNKPAGDNARKGAVRKRSQVKSTLAMPAPGPSAARLPENSWQ